MQQRISMRIYALALILTLTSASCSLFQNEDTPKKTSVSGLSFSSSTLSLGIGGVKYLGLTIQPSEAKASASIEYSYDSSIISVSGDSSGAAISGLRNGNTILMAKSNGQSAACVVGVTGIDPISENAPYITTTMPIVELEAGTTKKVIVSLSHGTSSDMAQFNWSIDKSSIASIESSGQNGILTGKTNGVARITVTHPTCTYPLELLVFVKPENERAVYLTTTQNILFLARDSPTRRVSISLVNATDDGGQGYTWEVLSNEESDPAAITVTSNGPNAEIIPGNDGRATIRITHPKALYPLDIKVRVVTIIENVYIEPENTKVVVSGTTPSRVAVTLKGSSRVIETDPAEYQWTIDDATICEMTPYQNEVVLSGLKNGIAKLTVTHPAAKYSREILVVVENQIEGAVHTGAYITTTQNYIRTKIGMTESELLVTLVGGEIGDEKDFVWSVSNPDIISIKTVNGTISQRSLFSRQVNATAFIEPRKEGSVVIYISHPKALSPTEVLVKVYPSYVSLESPLIIQGQSIIGMLRGTQVTTAVSLQGNATAADETSLVWTSENQSVVTVSGSGKEQLIRAVGNGQTFVTVTHPKAENPKKILCYVAETPEELDTMKVLYSEKTYYNLIAGKTDQLYLMTRNIPPEEQANIQWSSSNPSVATVAANDKYTVATVTGISSGTAIISASLAGLQTVKFTVTVYPVGTDIGVLPPSIFFTTRQNVVQFTNLNTDKTVSITPVNLPLSNYSGITWVSDNPSVVSVVANGDTATFTSKSKGEAVVTVAHPKAENILKIIVRIGDEYIIVNPKAPFISASKDVIGLVAGTQGEQITAKLENGQGTLFTWEIDNPSIAAISPLGDKCFVVPKAPGQARLVIRHADATYDKNVLVLVGNTQADIEGLSYLTTTQNVVRLVTGTQQTITVRLSGTPETSAADYSWATDIPSVLRIVDNGANAVFSGIGSGVARVTVTHASCMYPLDITCIVSDTAIDASASPYITTNQNIIPLTKGGASKNISIELAGGTPSDNQFFSWSVDRGDLLQLTANGQNATIKGLKTGECRISITHPKAQYPFTIVAIVEEPAPSSSLYINPSLPIVSMKPGSAPQTVTATLVGGTAEDKFGFLWSADNYNVIDLTYSANTAIITPRQEGKAEITISHPKSPYDAKVTVRVTEYSTFAFSQNAMTIPEGTTQFVSMQVPAIEGEYVGRVAYQTDNPKIVTITGTNKVAQVTALASGTATVTATSPSGAKSDLMVYVKKAAEMTAPYITSGTNVLPMKITDGQRSVTASIVGEGITTPDQYNLQWSIANPAIASLIGTSGTNVFVKPLKAGETTIQIKHPKTDSIFTMHVQVEGSVAGIALNKTYMALETGKTQEITASIDSGTTEDYKAIVWTADKVNGADIVSILGSGKTVAIYAIASGKTVLTAEFNGKTAKCDVTVEASRQFSFDTQTMRVQPGQSKTFKYVLVPADSAINWMTTSNDFISYTVDTVTKTVTVTGISEGSAQTGTVTKLSGIANSMTASINITCTWDYQFSLDKSAIVAEPRYDATLPDKFVIPYRVNPANADIAVQLTNDTLATYIIDKANKKIILTPRGEGTGSVLVTAKNPYNGYVFGTQTCALNFNYKTLTVQPRLVSKTGNFSRYDDSTKAIILGDGEDVTFELSVLEPNAGYTISSLKFEKTSGNEPIPALTKPLSTQWRLSHTQDYIVNEYLVTKETYFARTTNGYYVIPEIKWVQRKYNGDNYYYVADCGEGYFFVRYESTKGDHTGTMAYKTTWSYLDGDGTPNNDGTWNWTKQEKNLPTPKRVSIEEYRNNGNYYWPAHEQRHSYQNWGWKSYDGTWAAWDINGAQFVPSIDKTVKEIIPAGIISGTIQRSGSSAPLPISIPVYVEKRICSKNQN